MRSLLYLVRALAIVSLLLLLPGRVRSAPAGPGVASLRQPDPAVALRARPRYAFLLVLDGGLPSYFNLAKFPHLAALQREGVTYDRAWDGMLETETPTGHATLGTGTVPRRHGVMSFSWVTDTGTHEQPTNPVPIDQGQLEQVLARSGVPSLASALKRHDPSATIAVTSGHKDYAVDSVGGPSADYLMYYAIHNQMWTPVAIPRHVPPQSVLSPGWLTAYAPHLGPGDQDYLAIQLALSSFRQLHQRVSIINLPEFDWPLGHLLGGGADSNFAWKLMTRLDADIGIIEDELRREHVLRQTLFVLTADHGMLTLHHRIPHEVIQKAVAAAGTSMDDYEYHSAGYLWIRDRKKVPAVAARIAALHNPYIRAVYYRSPGSMEYLRAPVPGAGPSPSVEAANQFLLRTMASPSAPHIAIFLAENTAIVGRNEMNWQGDHGGGTWNAEHIPLLMAGPGIRQSVRSSFPATLYDVAPTILALMGAQWTGMDGVPLYNAFTDPDPSGVAVQRAQRAVREPVVQALLDQSLRDGP